MQIKGNKPSVIFILANSRETRESPSLSWNLPVSLLQHQISRELPTVALFTLHFLFINFVGNVLLLHWKKWNKKRSANKTGSHFENFWGCLQVFVLWGLAGMNLEKTWLTWELHLCIKYSVYLENKMSTIENIFLYPDGLILVISPLSCWSHVKCII